MTEFNYENYLYFSSQSLVHTINLLGNDLVGLELGTGSGNNLFGLLHNCPNIKEIHTIDNYCPYKDYIKKIYDNTSHLNFNESSVMLKKIEFSDKMKNFKCSEKIIFYEKNTNDCLELFDDEFFDFIFLDSYIDELSVNDDIENWYKKLKLGGLYSGHDVECDIIKEKAIDFSQKNNKSISIFNSCWCWIK